MSDGRHWPFNPKFKPLMTGPRNGPVKAWDVYPGSTKLPYHVEDSLRVMAGYTEGEITAGRELAVIAQALLAIAVQVARK